MSVCFCLFVTLLECKLVFLYLLFADLPDTQVVISTQLQTTSMQKRGMRTDTGINSIQVEKKEVFFILLRSVLANRDQRWC